MVSCGPPRVVAPDAAVVNDSRPVIRWTPVSGAGHYRVQLCSRVPEGRTLVTLDSVVQGAEFRPPQALAEYHAQVQVTVSAHCQDGYGPASDPNASGRFVIDTSPSCVLAPPLELNREGSRWRMTWRPVRQADFYHVALYEGREGKLLSQQEVRQPAATLDVASREPAMMMVRPHCLNGWGEPVYRALIEPLPN